MEESLKNLKSIISPITGIVSDIKYKVIQDHHVVFADLSPPEIKHANWYVIRAICPNFESFVSSALYEKPNLKRVNEVLRTFNKNEILNINYVPFPFP